MRKAFGAIGRLLVLLTATVAAHGDENTREFAVQVSAAVQASPARIRLAWLPDLSATPSSYVLSRRTSGANAWTQKAVLSSAATAYTDTDVTVGVPYEYQIVKQTPQYAGYGYVYSGIEVPAIEARGKVLLVVDKTIATNLTPELAQLEQDLVGDGWKVSRLNVDRQDSVVSVKNQIKAEYTADPANVKAVFLFGHIPVPYSGDLVPDGHAPDHQGAWPCDGFYGDMDGVWTDKSVNDKRASDVRNQNVPGDGKYDQSNFPAAIKLMVGRVDLANMPGRLSANGPATFPSELELMRNYLRKDHAFRHKQFDLPRRAVVGDFFGVRDGEAFAASGWRNFAPFVNADQITTLCDKGTWIDTMSTNACLWAYGCGPGSYTSIAGLGHANSYNDGVTTEMVQHDIKAVFTLLFGSWLGDWDSEDNMLRSILAMPSYGLASAWSGRPHWFLHHMALGEPIGFSARLTQNNRPGGSYLTQVNSCAGQTHIALMGDPTLRMHTVTPPSGLTATVNPDAGVTLNWTPSGDNVEGYYVYGASTRDGPFVRLTTEAIAGTSFTNANFALTATCMVRAVKLETSASGTYYNLSQGVFASPAAIISASLSGKDRPSSRPVGNLSTSTNSSPGTASANALSPTGRHEDSPSVTTGN